MSNRLDQQREKQLQPKRIQFAINQLKEAGFDCTSDDTKVEFLFKGNKITYFPYSGWHTGKSIKDGRGWKNLKKQIL